MNEPGINSFDEFLLFYLAATFVIGALWVILEADVVLGPVTGIAERRRRHRRISPVLAVLGVAHVAFALVAMDVTRADESDQPADEPARRRTAALARAGAIAGVVALALVCASHVPALSEVPGIAAVEQAIPWE